MGTKSPNFYGANPPTMIGAVRKLRSEEGPKIVTKWLQNPQGHVTLSGTLYREIFFDYRRVSVIRTSVLFGVKRACPCLSVVFCTVVRRYMSKKILNATEVL